MIEICEISTLETSSKTQLTCIYCIADGHVVVLFLHTILLIAVQVLESARLDVHLVARGKDTGLCGSRVQGPYRIEEYKISWIS